MPTTFDKMVRKVLIRSKNLDLNKIEALEEQARTGNTTFTSLVLANNVISEQNLVNLIALSNEIPPISLEKVSPSKEALEVLGKDDALKYFALPISKIEDVLTVAISDPFDPSKLQNLEIITNCKIFPAIAGESDIKKAIQAKYLTPSASEAEAKEASDADKAMEAAMSSTIEDIVDDAVSSGTGEGSEGEENVSEDVDSGIIKLANKIIIDAYQAGVSDIHIEPYHGKEATVVRFRADGDCYVYQKLPNAIKKSLVSRLKLMAGLDIAERRLPQDGKIAFKKFVKKMNIELRVATIPTVGGNEDAVMRILAASKPIPLDDMGFSERNLREFKKIVDMPYGLILVVGPTGSGKTTTLHSGLGFINTPDRKIWTAEDPVEITQRGLRQVQVQSKIGYTFARAMRAFLRADPDVIMVGEMRDEETAHMGIEASLTGHLVMSTLHTNSAPETITRLIDMGLDPFNFADALLGVLAQRLTRRLCKECKKKMPLSKEEYDEMVGDYDKEFFPAKDVPYEEGMQIFKPVGCEKCGKSGLKGRLGIHELLLGSDNIKALIQRRAKVQEIRDAAIKDGMTTLKQDGIMKVFKGITTLAEVRAVCIK